MNSKCNKGRGPLQDSIMKTVEKQRQGESQEQQRKNATPQDQKILNKSNSQFSSETRGQNAVG